MRGARKVVTRNETETEGIWCVMRGEGKWVAKSVTVTEEGRYDVLR